MQQLVSPQGGARIFPHFLSLNSTDDFERPSAKTTKSRSMLREWAVENGSGFRKLTIPRG